MVDQGQNTSIVENEEDTMKLNNKENKGFSDLNIAQEELDRIRAQKQHLMQECRGEIEGEDRKIQLLITKNERLRKQLDEYQVVLNKKIEKLPISKTESSVNLDKQLKIREKEIKNSKNYIELLKKENVKLKDKKESIVSNSKLKEVTARLEVEERRHENLTDKLKMLKRKADEIPSIENSIHSFREENRRLKDELLLQEEKNKDLQTTLSKEKNRVDELKNIIEKSKLELQKAAKGQEIPVKKRVVVKKLSDFKDPVSKKRLPKLPKRNEEEKDELNGFQPILTKKMKEEMTKLLGEAEVEKIEAKYLAIIKEKEREYQERLKAKRELTSNLKENEAQLKGIELKLKEEERKNKIYKLENNELNNEREIHDRKQRELESGLGYLQKILKEKEEEKIHLLEEKERLKNIISDLENTRIKFDNLGTAENKDEVQEEEEIEEEDS